MRIEGRRATPLGLHDLITGAACVLVLGSVAGCGGAPTRDAAVTADGGAADAALIDAGGPPDASEPTDAGEPDGGDASEPRRR